jgi:hypothetical protein
VVQFLASARGFLFFWLWVSAILLVIGTGVLLGVKRPAHDDDNDDYLLLMPQLMSGATPPLPHLPSK